MSQQVVVIDSMTKVWAHISWLPNEHGYAFAGLRHDGTTVQCRVERGLDGIHRVVGEELKNLCGWRPAKW